MSNWLWNVTPTPVANNIPNCVGGNVVTFGKFSSRHALRNQLANIAHVLLGEFCAAMQFTAVVAMSLSALAHHIRGVVFLGTKKQMRGVAARRIIAFVQHARFGVIGILWYRAVVEHPRESVRQSFGRALNNAIATLVATGLPLPTIVGSALAYFLPKAFFESRPLLNPYVVLVDESVRLSLDNSKTRITSFCHVRLLPAAAFTKTVGDFIKRELGLNQFWGMLRHVDYLLSGIGLIRGRVSRTLPGTFIAFTPSF